MVSSRESSNSSQGFESTKKRVVLVVDDEPMVREMVHEILTDAGHEVLVAASGAAAQQLVQDPGRRIDLLLTDIVMPGMDGLALSEEIRKHRPGLPVLFMSGYIGEASEEKNSKLAGRLIAKPFRPEDLVAEVAKALRGTRSTPEKHKSQGG